jgi:hypothetical protein
MKDNTHISLKITTSLHFTVTTAIFLPFISVVGDIFYCRTIVKMGNYSSVCLMTTLQGYGALIGKLRFERGSASEFEWRILTPEG